MKTRSTLTYSPGAFGPILAALGEEYLGWLDFAACAEVGEDVFFPEKGGTTRQAKAICAECPVAAECLDYQLAYEREHGLFHLHGVFGGMSAPERERIIAAEKNRQGLGAAAA